MSLLETLSSQELAQHLRNPAGGTGLAVADALGPINAEGNAGIVSSLALSPGDQVLEVGCGLATMAETVVGAADEIRYAGLDQSSTMVEGARARHRELIESGRASFHLGLVEQMPFDASCFTKVFSVGVVHFWADPIACLAEVKRVMQPGALRAMGALGPERAPAFAVREHGFYLYNVDEWAGFCTSAGLNAIDVRTTGSEQGPQGMYFTARA